MAFYLDTHKELTQITTRQDSALGIMRWGTDNSFPQTLKNLIEQSPSGKPAVSRTAKFLKGGKFEGEDQIVSPYGLTLKTVVSILAEDYAMFEAFAIQSNWNYKAQVTGMNPMRITDLRFNEFDELNFASKIGYHANFGRNSEVQKTIQNSVTSAKIKWMNRFNPSAVEKQIKECGGVDDYLGQLLYHTETGHSSYPIPPLQAQINYVLSDVENSILVRKETATGFISSYLLKTSLDAEDSSLIALENAMEEAQGARGAGKIITMSGMDPDTLTATVLEEIGGGNNTAIIDSAAKTYELDQKVINGAYLIPPILAGANQQTGFSSADLKEAYAVFNSITQGGRDTIEQQVNRVLKNSVFAIKEIELTRLQLEVDEVVAAVDPTAPAELSVVDFLAIYVEKYHKSRGTLPDPEHLMKVVNLFKDNSDV